MSTLREKIDVMEACGRGEKIEYREFGLDEWIQLTDAPMWNWENADYRVKPKARTDYGFKCDECGGWFKTCCPKCHPGLASAFALKDTTPKRLRPWTAKEAVGKVVHRKDEPNTLYTLTYADEHCIGPFMEAYISYTKLLAYYVQPDGSPCGVDE